MPSKPNSKDTHLYSTVLVKACCAYSVAPSYHRDSTFAVPPARRTPLCVHDWLLLILQGLILRIIFISEELKRPACTIPPRVPLMSSYSLHNIDHILLIILIAYLFIVRFFHWNTAAVKVPYPTILFWAVFPVSGCSAWFMSVVYSMNWVTSKILLVEAMRKGHPRQIKNQEKIYCCRRSSK